MAKTKKSNSNSSLAFASGKLANPGALNLGATAIKEKQKEQAQDADQGPMGLPYVEFVHKPDGEKYEELKRINDGEKVEMGQAYLMAGGMSRRIPDGTFAVLLDGATYFASQAGPEDEYKICSASLSSYTKEEGRDPKKPQKHGRSILLLIFGDELHDIVIATCRHSPGRYDAMAKLLTASNKCIDTEWLDAHPIQAQFGDDFAALRCGIECRFPMVPGKMPWTAFKGDVTPFPVDAKTAENVALYLNNSAVGQAQAIEWLHQERQEYEDARIDLDD